MASDAYNYEKFFLHIEGHIWLLSIMETEVMVSIHFITQRKALYHDWSADDRVPIRCVKALK